MANYISSNANRFYTAVESTYGQAAAVAVTNRVPALKLHANQAIAPGKRRDKTGSRTFLGSPAAARRRTAFELQSYLTSWSGAGEPSYGPLFQAGFGGAPLFTPAMMVSAVFGPTSIQTAAPHGLSIGAGISYLGEIRFVTNVPDAVGVLINAPFSNSPAVGAILSPTISYSLAAGLPSISIYDYWSPSDAISRLITGAAVDSIDISVNGDYHKFSFSGPARDLLDSATFVSGTAGLSAFPVEPATGGFDYSIVPGHLGQVWLGSSASQFYTLTSASIQIKNNLELRNQEFGSSYPSAVVAGPREVLSNFTLMVQDDAQSTALYAAAKQRTVISAMLQLGQQQGQLMGIFLPSVTPEIPSFDDAETRLQWQFNNSLAHGVSDDEIYLAFA